MCVFFAKENINIENIFMIWFDWKKIPWLMRIFEFNNGVFSSTLRHIINSNNDKNDKLYMTSRHYVIQMLKLE